MSGGRQQFDLKTNTAIESLGRNITSLNAQIQAQAKKFQQMGSLLSNTITQPTPGTPFKIFERATNEGLMLTVTGLCPSNTEKLKFVLSRKSRNQILLKKDGTPKETVSAAKTRIQRESKALTFTALVDENEASAQVFSCEIGPIPPAKDLNDNALQLFRIVAYNEKGAFAKNPTINPFGGTMLPDPIAAPIPALAAQGAGMLSIGAYKYVQTFLDQSNQETAPSPVSVVVNVVDPTTNGKVSVTIATGPANKTKARKLYRTVANGTDFKLIDTILNNVDVASIDNKPDAALGIPPPTVNQSAGVPVRALQVETTDDVGTPDDDRYFFLIGGAVSGTPSSPALPLYCNMAKMQAHASHAKSSFQIFADAADDTLTFEDTGTTEMSVQLRRKNDAAAVSSDTDDRAHLHQRVTVDPAATSVIVDFVLDFGDIYTWVSNTAHNSAGRVKSTGPAVDFIAGGDTDITHLVAAYTGQSGASTDGRLRLTIGETAGGHTKFLLTATQPGGSANPCAMAAVVFKKVEILEKEPGSTEFQALPHHSVLSHEEYFVPGTEVKIYKKIPHRHNQTNYQYKARLYKITDTTVFIETVAITVDTSFTVAPSTPILADLIQNEPDDDTAESDAFSVHRVYASEADKTLTYRQVGADHAWVVLRRKKKTSVDSPGDDRDINVIVAGQMQTAGVATKLPKVGGPVENVDLPYTFITVRRLKLRRQYYWYKNLTARNGIKSPSAIPTPNPPGGVPFVAGAGLQTGDAFDPTRLLNIGITFSPIHKNQTRATVSYDQPSSPGGGAPIVGAQPLPVLMQHAELLLQYKNDTTTFPVHEKDLRKFAEYSDNTSGVPPRTDAALKQRKVFHFHINHREAEAAISVKVRLTAIGGAFVDSAAFTFDSSDDAPSFAGTTVPSSPRAQDIVSTTTGHISARATKTVITAYASEWRNMGVPAQYNGIATGPVSTVVGDPNINNHTVSWADIKADKVNTVLLKTSEIAGATIGKRYRKHKAVDIIDLSQNFIEIEIDKLALGESFTHRLTVAKRAGAKAMSASTDVAFIAGGRIGSATLSELKGPVDSNGNLTAATPQVSVDYSDAHFTQVITDLSQPLSNEGGAVLLYKMILRRKRFTQAGGVLDAEFKRCDHDNLLDQPIFNTTFTGTRQNLRVVLHDRHKKNEKVQYEIDILGVGNSSTPEPTLTLFYPSSTTTMDVGTEQLYEDTGAPGAVGTPTVNFTGKGMSVHFVLPTTNMVTHYKNTVVFKNNATTPIYWNPIDGTTGTGIKEVEIAKGHYTFAVRKRTIPATFTAGATSFTVQANVYNLFNLSSVSSAISLAVTFSSLTDVIDVSNSLTTPHQVLHNGDFTYAGETDAAAVFQAAALKKWKLSVGGDVIFDNANINKQISWSMANHSLLLRGNQGSGNPIQATPAIKLGKRLVPGDFFSLSFLARSNGTISVSVTCQLCDNSGNNIGSFSLTMSLTTAYQYYAGVMQLSTVADTTNAKWFQFILLTSILWTQNIEIDRVMLVRGKQPSAYAPRALFEQNSAVQTDTNFNNENFDINAGSQNASLDLASPSGTEGGGFNSGTGGVIVP